MRKYSPLILVVILMLSCAVVVTDAEAHGYKKKSHKTSLSSKKTPHKQKTSCSKKVKVCRK